MKFKKLASAIALASTAAFSTGAFAAPTILNTDGLIADFGGFDWASGSVAWTKNFGFAPGTKFSLFYAGWAADILDTTGSVLTPDPTLLDKKTDGVFKAGSSYEYTIWAEVKEEVIACVGNTCTFKVLGGNFDIYYDSKLNAGAGTEANGGTAVQTNLGLGAWTGFQDGTKIISGTFDPTSNSQTFTTGGNDGSNSTTLTGTIAAGGTNAAYVNPALNGTRVTSTLQFGTSKTATVSPTSVDGKSTQEAGQILFQADANQSLFVTKVPEPSALALVGLALTGLGLASRRRKA